jgi:hypothetical protein
MAIPLQRRQRAICDARQEERDELILRLQDLLCDDEQLCTLVDEADATKDPNAFLRKAINDLHSTQDGSPMPMAEGDAELLSRHGVTVVPFYGREWTTSRQSRQRVVEDVLAGWQIARSENGVQLVRGPASGWNRVCGMAGYFARRSSAVAAGLEYCREQDAQAAAAAVQPSQTQEITVTLPWQPVVGTAPAQSLSPIRLDSASAGGLLAVQRALLARGERIDGIGVVTLTLAAKWILQQLSSLKVPVDLQKSK